MLQTTPNRDSNQGIVLHNNSVISDANFKIKGDSIFFFGESHQILDFGLDKKIVKNQNYYAQFNVESYPTKLSTSKRDSLFELNELLYILKNHNKLDTTLISFDALELFKFLHGEKYHFDIEEEIN